MTTATTAKQINLAQLNAELGSPGLNSQRTDTGTTVNAPDSVPQAALDAAIAAHVANPDYERPAEDVAAKAMRTKAQQVLAGQATFTAAELQRIAAVAVLRASRPSAIP